MSKTNDNKLNMFLAVKEFFVTWIAMLNLLPHFTEFHSSFLEELQIIQSLLEQQLFDKKRNGIIAQRDELKLTLITITAQAADKLYACALFIKDQVLQNELQYSLSKMKQSSDTTVLKWSKGIYDRVNNHLTEAASYGLTEATQIEFKSMIDAFEVLIPSQRVSATQKKLVTKQLVEHFDNADEALLQIDALVKILSSTEPNVYSMYDQRRKILNYGTRTLALRGQINDSITKLGLKGVTIEFLNEDGKPLQPSLIKKSASKGGFNIKTLAEGIYQVKMKKVGYNDLIITITVARGELCKISAEMTKI
jgi:hypothetical protein